VVLYEYPLTTLHVINAIVGNLEITCWYPLSKFCSEQARAPWYKSISHFPMGLNGSLYDYVTCGTNCYPTCITVIPTWVSQYVFSLLLF